MKRGRYFFFKISHLWGLELKILYNFWMAPKKVIAAGQLSAACSPHRFKE